MSRPVFEGLGLGLGAAGLSLPWFSFRDSPVLGNTVLRTSLETSLSVFTFRISDVRRFKSDLSQL